MEASIVKHSIVIAGHKTSISLEDGFWTSFREIARERNVTLSELAALVNSDRQPGSNLSSAIRCFVLGFYRDQIDHLSGTREAGARGGRTNEKLRPRAELNEAAVNTRACEERG
jgi:predicted DNA-binding ribbon-helix-helix protein